MTKVRTLLAATAIALAAAPQAGVAFQERPVRSLLEARHQNVVLQEWDTSCGAAALATVLKFQFGDQVTERNVAVGMIRLTDPDRVRGRGGFSLLDMKRYAESRGLAAEGYAGLTAVQLMRAAPAIVPIVSHAGDHFVVFRGVVQGQAVIADPAFGNRSLPFAEFESRWKDRLAFVVKAKGKAANRLFASRRDLLRVQDDSERQAADDRMPKALSDFQLSGAFAVGIAAPGSPGPDFVQPPPGVAAPRPGQPPGSSVPPAANAPPSASAGPIHVSSPPGSSATVTPVSASPIPVSTSPISVSTPPISVSTPPALPPVGVALPPVTIAVPTLPIPVPLGR